MPAMSSGSPIRSSGQLLTIVSLKRRSVSAIILLSKGPGATALGALHVLVNNAGPNWGAPYAEFPDSAWDKALAVNLKGVFFLLLRRVLR
jgi:NAD(P)-dependent dehydrogenase (short-subunit alcohol dehydrogenase family)